MKNKTYQYHLKKISLCAVIFLILPGSIGSVYARLSTEQETVHWISTFSIVGRDAETGELGIAVASRFFAVGSVVPWAKADVGAVATQSYANTSFGWRGLALLEKGATPEEIVQIQE